MFTKEQDSEKVRLTIRNDLSIYTAKTLREALLDCLDTPGDLEIDLSEVSDCDAAGLQLLWAVRKSALHRKKSFRIVAAPAAISEVIKTAGMNQVDVFGE